MVGTDFDESALALSCLWIYNVGDKQNRAMAYWVVLLSVASLYRTKVLATKTLVCIMNTSKIQMKGGKHD